MDMPQARIGPLTDCPSTWKELNTPIRIGDGIAERVRLSRLERHKSEGFVSALRRIKSIRPDLFFA